MKQRIESTSGRTKTFSIYRGLALGLGVFSSLTNLLSAAAAPLPNSLKLTVTVGGAQKTLNLHRRSIRGANFEVKSWTTAGGYVVQSPTPEVRTYRGTVAEDSNTLVCASINSSGSVEARFFDLNKGKGIQTTITEDVSSQLLSPIAALAMPVQATGSPRDANSAVSLAGPKVPTGISPTTIPYGELVEVEQATDVTNHSYNTYGGDVDNILARYELDLLVYDMMMTRDCLTRVVLPQIVIRQDQFYASSTTPGLQEMDDEWKSSALLSTDWDMVWATEGYYAWGNNVGKDEKPMAAGALYHETGHNWGAFHLAYAYDTMGGNRPLHEAYSVDVMLAKRAESIDEGDLTLSAAYSDPLHPHTHTDVARIGVNTATDINVLANDWDANGDTLSISSHTTATEGGGAVTLNPDGTLRYTPATGFVGKDMIVYTVQDSSTMQLKAREIVHIEVVNSGLMLHYAFDETSGSTVTDSSGVGSTGSLNGADFSTHAVASPLGKGVKVWGWQNDNDEENTNWSGVVVGSGSVLPVTAIADRGATPFDSEHNAHSGHYDVMDGDFTASTFFCVDDYNFNDGYTSSGAPWIFTKWWHSEQKCGWGLQATGESLVMYYSPFDGSEAVRTVTANYDFEAGKWYHTSVVFDRALNEVRLYVNGEEIGKQTSAFPADAPFIFNGRVPMRLGTYGAEKVSLDDFRLYSKALSPSEIDALVSAAGTTKFLSDDKASVQHYMPLTLSYDVAADVWDGGGSNITYTKQSGDTWINLSADGKVTGTAPAAGVYNFTVQVANAAGDTDSRQYELTIVKNGVYYERFAITGATVAGLTSHASFPHSPTIAQVIDHAEIPANVADNYGSRMQAYLVPDTTGDYTFWVAGDDAGELWLSSDESTENAAKIATLPGYTPQYAWDTNAAQKSVTISLVAGQKYYLMALHAEGSGGDRFSVAWDGPGVSRQLISNSNLEIYHSNIIAKWAFDENSGTTTDDGAPYGIDGTLDAAAWTTGKRGSAVSIANSGISLGKNDLAGDWTWSGWVKRTGAATAGALMASSSEQVRLEQYHNTHKVGYTRFGHADWSTTYSAPEGSWVYLSLVMDDSEFKVYENGELKSSVTVTGGDLPLNAIGSGLAELDDVVIYNEALSASELLPFSVAEGNYTVLENVGASADVASAAGKNVWGVALNYSITAGNTGGAFAINASTGEITVVGDITGGEQYVLTVTANDGSGLIDSGMILVDVEAVNAAPTVASASYGVAESITIGTTVATINITDTNAADTHTCAITAGNDAGKFAISNTGVITTTATLNYEETTSYALTITVTDSGSPALSSTGVITVNVTDVDESTLTGAQAWEEVVQKGSATALTRTEALAGNTTTTIDLSMLSGDSTFEFIIEAEDLGQASLDILTGNGRALKLEQWANQTKLGATQFGVADWVFTAEAGQSVATPYGAVHNVTFVVDTAASETRAYIDGIHVGTLAQVLDFGSASIVLGASNLRSDSSPGIHAFAAYNSALDISEILVHSTAWFGAPSNTAPVAADAAFSVAENVSSGAAVGTVTATDLGDTLSYAITGGNTGRAFAINSATGQITTTSALDAETTANYSLIVTATDSGSLSDTATVTVTVTNVNEAPVAANASGSVAENTAAGAVIATVTSSDPDDSDSVTYAITGGNTGNAFAINSATGQITTTSALDAETTANYSLIVTATDSGSLTDTATVTVTVTNVNEAPVVANASGSLAESATSGSSVATVTSTDVDANDGVIYAITAGNTGSVFAINSSTGAITTAGSLDFETASNYSLTVTVTDVGGLTDTAVVTVTVTNVNEAPVMNDTAGSLAESAASGSAVVTVNSSDEDANDSVIYAITAGNTGSAFAINSSTGAITTAASLDFETASNYSLTVTATDVGGLTDTAVVAVTVTNVNEAPVANDAAVNLAESATSGSAVTTVSSSDVDASDSVTYAITAGDAGSAFAINSSTGEITTASALNHEAEGSYALTVTATDAGGLSDAATIAITVTDADESGLSGVQAWEDAVHNGSSFDHKRTATLAGNATASVDLSAISGDATYEFIVDAEELAQSEARLLDGNGWSIRFEQWSNSNKLGLTRYGVADYTLTAETGQSVASPYGAVHHLVYVVDSINTMTHVYVDSVLVGTVAQAPDFGSSSILLGFISLRDDANPGIKAFAAYNSALNAVEVLAHQQAWFGSVQAKVTNQTPVIENSTFTVAEDIGSGSSVGSIVAVGSDDAVSYAITAGNGGGAFSVNTSSGAITTAASLNYEATSSYSLTITATDTEGLTDTAVATVNVTNVNEAPILANSVGVAADQDQAYSGSVASSGSDVDAGDSLSFSKVSGPVWLNVASSGSLSGTPGSSDTGANQWTVRATDAAGLNVDGTLAITVNAAAPTSSLAIANTTTSGVSSGSYTSVQSNDGVLQVLTEKVQGRNSKAKSLLEHQWEFNITAGSVVTLRVDAFHSVNSEGDDFVFAYSTDGSVYTDVLTVTKVIDDGVEQTASLPVNLTGTVYIRVKDTDQSRGNAQQDSLYVDLVTIEVTQ